MSLLQGWTLDPTYPLNSSITPDTILSSTTALNPIDERSYIQTHTHKLLTHPLLPSHPPSTLIRILRQPNLSIPEDDVLQHVLSYASARLSLAPENGNGGDSERVRELLKDVLPLIKYGSLSTSSVLRLEELGLVAEEKLLAIYREKALQRCGALAGDTRGRAVIAESEHPLDGETVVTEVVVGSDACVVEFDRRCDVRDAWLGICLDRSCERVFVEWGELWRRRGSVKVLCVPAGAFYVVCRRGRGAWGWKLFAVPASA